MMEESGESKPPYLRAKELLEDALHEVDGSLACDIEEFLTATADGAPCPGCGVAPGALHGSTCVFYPSHNPPRKAVVSMPLAAVVKATWRMNCGTDVDGSPHWTVVGEWPSGQAFLFFPFPYVIVNDDGNPATKVDLEAAHLGRKEAIHTADDGLLGQKRDNQ